MSKPKRFNTRQEILDAIDRKVAKRRQHELQAESLEYSAKRDYKEAAKYQYGTKMFTAITEGANKSKKDAMRLRSRVKSAVKAVERLKNTLAAFDTETMPGVLEDGSVVLQ